MAFRRVLSLLVKSKNYKAKLQGNLITVALQKLWSGHFDLVDWGQVTGLYFVECSIWRQMVNQEDIFSWNMTFSSFTRPHLSLQSTYQSQSEREKQFSE